MSLGIQDVNINGMPCGMKEGSGTMQYRACLEADAAGSLALDDGTSAGGGSLGGSSGACWAAFCCGVVLVDVYPPPPPPPPPPSPLPPLDTPAAPVGNEAQPQGWQQQPQQPQSNRTSSGGSGKSSAVAAAAGGGGGAAVALLLSAGVLWLRQRRRRARRLAQAATDTLAASKAGGGQGGRTLGSVLGPCTHGMRHDSMAGGASALASPSSVALTPGGCQVTIAPSIPGAPAPAGPDKSGGISASSGGSGCVGSEAGLADEITLHEQLGSGAFGVVWKASWRGSLVAVKVLQTAAAASSRELSSFQLEARVLSQLQHPHIVCFLAACTGERMWDGARDCCDAALLINLCATSHTIPPPPPLFLQCPPTSASLKSWQRAARCTRCCTGGPARGAAARCRTPACCAWRPTWRMR